MIEPTNEQWECDTGFIIGPRNFFHIKDVLHLTRSEETHIFIAFTGSHIEIDFKTLEGRDTMYEWFVQRRIEYFRLCQESNNISKAMHKAQLEIQNRLAGHVIEKH